MLSETCNPELGQNYGIQVLPDPKCLPHLLAPVALGILAARTAANSEYFCVCQSVLARARDAWLQQPLGNLPFPREIPAPASSMWLWVLSRESGEWEEVAAAKHLVPEVKRNLGEVRNQPALAQGSSWNIQALPCRSTFFFSCWENQAEWKLLASTPTDVWL